MLLRPGDHPAIEPSQLLVRVPSGMSCGESLIVAVTRLPRFQSSYYLAALDATYRKGI